MLRIARLLLAAMAVGLRPTPAAAQVDAIAPGSWTLAVLPDTQVYAESFPQHFDAQTQWLVDNAESLNLKFVLHEGDVTNHNNTPQWDNAHGSLSILDGQVPYAVAPGNHDYGPGGNAADRNTLFNTAEYFGPGTPYATQPTVGGFFEPGKTDNSYHRFQAGGQDWLVLALEFGPRNEVVDWANQIVSSHPDDQVMLVTHAYMYFDETIYDWGTKGASQNWNPHAYGVARLPGESVNDGQELWDKLVSQHENFRLTFNGHVLGDGTGYRSTEGAGGAVVHQMLANYQFNQQGGMGDMRLLEFKPDGETVVVRTYSPVLDRHDRSFDQEFTINLNQLRDPLTPPPPPLLDTVLAGNLTVTGPTDPASNTVESAAFSQSTIPALQTLQVNRGDYQIGLEGEGLTHHQGVLMASIRENTRDGLSATVEVGRSSFGDGVLSLSVMETGNAGDNEVNFNTGVAWFQFATGWQGAHVNGSGELAVAASNRVEPEMVERQSAGRYRVDLGVDPGREGLLFAVGGTNGNTVVQTSPIAGRDGYWDLRVQDNATGFAETGSDTDFAFVYLPIETPGLVGGWYDGGRGASLLSSGDYQMARVSKGLYELRLPGVTPDDGVLLLTIAEQTSGGGATGPEDNVLSYEPADDGAFVIAVRDLPTGGLEDGSFAWAFISFADPLRPLLAAGDFNGDGVVDTADYAVWRTTFGSTTDLRADANGDGQIDTADYTLWRDSLGAASPLRAAPPSGVPEVATAVTVAPAIALAGLSRGVRPADAADGR